MHVRKFEADSLDEALKQIKHELGPDAIILKTITNKGFKGAFKKKKIEITAAISEKNYSKKMHVDRVLDDSQKTDFYSSSSSYISNMIDGFTGNKSDQSKESSHNQVGISSGYGKLGLNRAVNTTVNKTKEVSEKMKSSLDDFLNFHSGSDQTISEEVSSTSPQLQNNSIENSQASSGTERINIQNELTTLREAVPSSATEAELQDAKNKIDELEKKLYELTAKFDRLDKREPTGVYQLRTTLRSLEINEFYIQDVIKKCCFDLTDDELRDQDVVFEFALREMLSEIQTEMPLFSSLDDEQPVITVLISETSSGQTSMIQKLGALKDNAVIVRNNDLNEDQSNKINFAEKLFGMGVIQTDSIPQIISNCRKGVEQNKCIFVDYKISGGEVNETKKLIDGLRRSFDKVEVLISLSAIHTETYNRKVVSRYQDLADGMIVSSLDMCLNYGGLFNLAQGYKQLPLKFFGTGEVIPDDIESATAERILAGVFKLNE